MEGTLRVAHSTSQSEFGTALMGSKFSKSDRSERIIDLLPLYVGTLKLSIKFVGPQTAECLSAEAGIQH